MKFYLGIDPGKNGALALIGDDHAEVHCLPKAGKELSRKQFVELVRDLKTGRDIFAVLENVGSRGGANGFQHACGVAEGVLASLSIPYEWVRAQDWKAVMLRGTKKDKGAAILKAERLFPTVDIDGDKKSREDKAEALLLALYAKFYDTGMLPSLPGSSLKVGNREIPVIGMDS